MSLVVVCSLFAINNCDVHCSLIEPVPSAAPKSQLCVVIEPNLLVSSRILEENKVEMPPKSNNQKKKEAEAAGRAPKKTKQQENAGGSTYTTVYLCTSLIIALKESLPVKRRRRCRRRGLQIRRRSLEAGEL